MKSKSSTLVILFLLILLSRCGSKPERSGQQQQLKSPSGNYTVEMPILKAKETMDNPVWTPTIKNSSGKILYRDNASRLSGYHNSYWEWITNANGHEILRVYNSDTGEVILYYQSNGEWIKECCLGDCGKMN